MSYLYQSGYYSYLIRVGLGFGEDTQIVLALFTLCLLGCQSLGETLFGKYCEEIFLSKCLFFFLPQKCVQIIVCAMGLTLIIKV